MRPARDWTNSCTDRVGMPFKSQAQRRKFAELLVEGKISNETFEEWNRETGGRKLPERVGARRQLVRSPGGNRRSKGGAGDLNAHCSLLNAQCSMLNAVTH